MIKRKITETTEKYDKDGKLIEKIIKEEIIEDDKSYPNGACFMGSIPAGTINLSSLNLNNFERQLGNWEVHW